MQPIANAELTAKLAAALKAVMPYANADNDFATEDYKKHNAALSDARAALADYDHFIKDESNPSPSADEFKGHELIPISPDVGPCRWQCTRCKERSADQEWFRKYECTGQPDAVGGG